MGIDDQMSRHHEDIPSLVGAVQQSPAPSTITDEQALHKLMQTLKSPNTPEQQNQILQILKSSPPLMSAFIKQRQQQLVNNLRGAAGDLREPSQPQEQQSDLQHSTAQLLLHNNNSNSNNGSNET